MFGFMKKAPDPPAPSGRAAGAPRTVADAFGPPLAPEETSGNLTVLQQRMDREMKCPAGKGQVYLRSLLTGKGTTKPRIALRCSLRKDVNLPREVFFEHIRDVCCGDPDQCVAYQAFKARGS
ncbi:MAG: hypothetical protein IPM64_02095 [Phycisphaerales bacterium]|nr:hypothetical protein [Phycisphaerales bacterium]